MPENRKPLLLTGADIFYRNFAGIEREFNPAGQRNFCVGLDPKLAEQLAAEGWNIKYRKQLDEGDPVRPYIQVKVSFDRIPPKVKLITSTGTQVLDEDTIWALDTVELERVDLTINPSHWEVNGNKGVKAYLRSIFVTAHEDELDLLYADKPAAEELGKVLAFNPEADVPQMDLSGLMPETEVA